MLLYTWPILFCLLIVLPMLWILRTPPFWLAGLLAASCFVYAWWNPYYLALIVYIAVMVYLTAALRDMARRGLDVCGLGRHVLI